MAVQMVESKHVQRIQQNILAAAERRLLDWLCARVPARIMPDHMTAIGVLGWVAVAAGYALSPYRLAWLWLSIAGFCINWFGDSLDGSLARFRKSERPQFGYFIDHSLDAIGNLAIALGLAASSFVRLDVALFAISGYLLLSVHTFLTARQTGQFQLTYLAGGPTELRLMLIAMTLLMLATGPRSMQVNGWSVFDLFIGGFGVLLIMLFVLQTARIGRELFLSGK